MSSKLIWTCDSCGFTETFTEGDATEIPETWRQGVLVRKNKNTGKYDQFEWEDLCPTCWVDR